MKSVKSEDSTQATLYTVRDNPPFPYKRFSTLRPEVEVGGGARSIHLIEEMRHVPGGTKTVGLTTTLGDSTCRINSLRHVF